MTAESFSRIARAASFHDAGHGFDVFGLHPPSLVRAIDAATYLYERYFRVDSRGVERIPASGPTILVANHAGVLPVDAAMLCIDVLRGTNPPRIPRAIADFFVARVPVVSRWFARVGVVSGTRENVCHLLEAGELVALWPEGVTGPAKAFRDRYHLQAWRVGFAELAIRYRATIVPVAIIGAEESWPLARKVPLGMAVGAPYWPIPFVPLPLPAHYHLRYGAPIQLSHDLDPDDPHAVACAASSVRDALQQLVDDTRIARRGVFR